MCRVLEVSQRGYFDSLKKKELPKDHEKQRVVEEVRQIHQKSYQSYGTRRMAKALTEKGYSVGRYKAGRLMKEAGVSVKKKKILC